MWVEITRARRKGTLSSMLDTKRTLGPVLTAVAAIGAVLALMFAFGASSPGTAHAETATAGNTTATANAAGTPGYGVGEYACVDLVTSAEADDEDADASRIICADLVFSQ